MTARKIFLTIFIFISFNCYAQIEEAINIAEDGDSKGLAQVTLLMTAAADNDVEAVKFFTKVNDSAAIVNKKNIGGATALHMAARNGNIEIAKILIESGADVNAADNEGWTPLMRACVAKNADIAKLFLENKADLYLQNLENKSAIFYAASFDCKACVEIMLSNAGDVLQNSDQDYFKKQLVASYEIARAKQNQPIKELLEKYLDKNLEIAATPQMLPQAMNENVVEKINEAGEKEKVKYVLNNKAENSEALPEKVAEEEKPESLGATKIEDILLGASVSQAPQEKNEEKNEEEKVIYVLKSSPQENIVVKPVSPPAIAEKTTPKILKTKALKVAKKSEVNSNLEIKKEVPPIQPVAVKEEISPMTKIPENSAAVLNENSATKTKFRFVAGPQQSLKK